MAIDVHTIIYGALLSGSMIVAIGAQNLFVIKNGITGRHIFAVSLVCFLCDAVLMTTGIFGLGTFFQKSKILTLLLALAGSAFLLFYGISSFKSALQLKKGMGDQFAPVQQQDGLGKTVRKTLYITLLNPHVYIDTVLIVGGIGATLSDTAKYHFLTGALAVSCAWFFALGYGARAVSGLFKRRAALMTLDIVIGLIMVLIAANLLKFAWTTIH